MRERFMRFMQGRYGIDSFGKFTLVVAVVLLVLGMIADNSLFTILSYALLIYTYYRMFSRQTYKRAAENQNYMARTANIRRWFAGQRFLRDQRKDYHIYTCPSCGQKIRIPKGKGKIEISCPRCSNTFIKNS